MPRAARGVPYLSDRAGRGAAARAGAPGPAARRRRRLLASAPTTPPWRPPRLGTPRPPGLAGWSMRA